VTVDAPEQDWQQILTRRSFLEGDALTRAEALLDTDSARVLCGPFDRLESPWLEPQGIVPQADDGVVIARGSIGGRPVVIASIEQGFQGGGTGEVSGAKISHALRLAADACRAGTPTAAALLLETGGVRLQEANLGLNAVAEICSSILDLRQLAPVIGVVAGEVGCYGGVSIAAGLCTRLIVTPQGRLALNGAAVIEQEHGLEEFDSSDRALIWSMEGGEQRVAIALADELVPDDADKLRAAVSNVIAAGVAPAGSHRSERVDVLAARLAALDPAAAPTPQDLRRLWGPTYEPVGHASQSGGGVAAAAPGPSRGRTWLRALAATDPTAVIGSVIKADTADATYLAVVPDPHNRFPRARSGEVGLTESWALADTIQRVIDENVDADTKPAIVAVVDLPSQAYGRIEELAGEHQAIATAVDAYHRARNAGHPIVAIVVGTALSGGFLAHGLQAQQILALDDPGVQIHAMHKAAAARITLRTVAELEELAATILPLSYNVRDWAQLGFCDGLLAVSDADAPTADDIAAARDALRAAISAARAGPRDLSNRLDSPGAIQNRKASRTIRDTLAAQWHGSEPR
jgi:biotin-independent malonate decarboxylase beta subunit/biotin-independent malonate decarboxylase gamma subunit